MVDPVHLPDPQQAIVGVGWGTALGEGFLLLEIFEGPATAEGYQAWFNSYIDPDRAPELFGENVPGNGVMEAKLISDSATELSDWLGPRIDSSYDPYRDLQYPPDPNPAVIIFGQNSNPFFETTGNSAAINIDLLRALLLQDGVTDTAGSVLIRGIAIMPFISSFIALGESPNGGGPDFARWDEAPPASARLSWTFGDLPVVETFVSINRSVLPVDLGNPDIDGIARDEPDDFVYTDLPTLTIDLETGEGSFA